MSDTPDSTNTSPPTRSAPSAKAAPKRNTKKLVAATIAVVATLAASGAAVAVNLGASEPPLDPAAGQLTPTAAATSAERVTTDPPAIDLTGTQAIPAPQGTAPGTPDDCDDDHGDCSVGSVSDHDKDHDSDHDKDHDKHDGADDDD